MVTISFSRDRRSRNVRRLGCMGWRRRV